MEPEQPQEPQQPQQSTADTPKPIGDEPLMYQEQHEVSPALNSNLAQFCMMGPEAIEPADLHRDLANRGLVAFENCSCSLDKLQDLSYHLLRHYAVNVETANIRKRLMLHYKKNRSFYAASLQPFMPRRGRDMGAKTDQMMENLLQDDAPMRTVPLYLISHLFNVGIGVVGANNSVWCSLATQNLQECEVLLAYTGQDSYTAISFAAQQLYAPNTPTRPKIQSTTSGSTTAGLDEAFMEPQPGPSVLGTLTTDSTTGGYLLIEPQRPLLPFRPPPPHIPAALGRPPKPEPQEEDEDIMVVGYEAATPATRDAATFQRNLTEMRRLIVAADQREEDQKRISSLTDSLQKAEEDRNTEHAEREKAETLSTEASKRAAELESQNAHLTAKIELMQSAIPPDQLQALKQRVATDPGLASTQSPLAQLITEQMKTQVERSQTLQDDLTAARQESASRLDRINELEKEKSTSIAELRRLTDRIRSLEQDLQLKAGIEQTLNSDLATLKDKVTTLEQSSVDPATHDALKRELQDAKNRSQRAQIHLEAVLRHMDEWKGTSHNISSNVGIILDGIAKKLQGHHVTSLDGEDYFMHAFTPLGLAVDRLPEMDLPPETLTITEARADLTAWQTARAAARKPPTPPKAATPQAPATTTAPSVSQPTVTTGTPQPGPSTTAVSGSAQAPSTGGGPTQSSLAGGSVPTPSTSTGTTTTAATASQPVTGDPDTTDISAGTRTRSKAQSRPTKSSLTKDPPSSTPDDPDATLQADSSQQTDPTLTQGDAAATDDSAIPDPPTTSGRTPEDQAEIDRLLKEHDMPEPPTVRILRSQIPRPVKTDSQTSSTGDTESAASTLSSSTTSVKSGPSTNKPKPMSAQKRQRLRIAMKTKPKPTKPKKFTTKAPATKLTPQKRPAASSSAAGPSKKVKQDPEAGTFDADTGEEDDDQPSTSQQTHSKRSKTCRCPAYTCREKFQSYNQCNVHAKEKHGDKPFACRVKPCDVRCSRIDDYLKHYRTAHPENVQDIMQFLHPDTKGSSHK